MRRSGSYTTGCWRRGLYAEDAAEQLREAARIATTDIPELLAPARELRTQWSEQQLLDPAAAETTAGELVAALDKVQPTVSGLRARQDGIARAFRAQLR